MPKLLPYEIGEIPLHFLKSTLGGRLGVYGADAQTLGFYLLANPYLDPCGVYALPLEAITHHTGISLQRVKVLLHRLWRLDFCHYDFEKELVSVRLLGEIYGFSGSASDKHFPPQAAKEDNHATA